MKMLIIEKIWEMWNRIHRFTLKTFLISQMVELKDAWLAPLYFHFGHYSWFINFISIFQDTGDIFLFFVICFAFIGGVSLLKNEKFQNFVQKINKNINNNFNFLPLSTYFQIYQIAFVNTYNFLTAQFNKIFLFFKNKRKNK
jgi:hypothetical protein